MRGGGTSATRRPSLWHFQVPTHYSSSYLNLLLWHPRNWHETPFRHWQTWLGSDSSPFWSVSLFWMIWILSAQKRVFNFWAKKKEFWTNLTCMYKIINRSGSVRKRACCWLQYFQCKSISPQWHALLLMDSLRRAKAEIFSMLMPGTFAVVLVDNIFVRL